MKLTQTQQSAVDLMRERRKPFVVNKDAHATPQRTITTYKVDGEHFRHATFAALRNKRIIQYYGEVRGREQWILTDEYKASRP